MESKVDIFSEEHIGVIEDKELFMVAIKIETYSHLVMDTTKKLPGEDDDHFSLRKELVLNTAGEEQGRDATIREDAVHASKQEDPKFTKHKPKDDLKPYYGPVEPQHILVEETRNRVDIGTTCTKSDRIANITNIILSRLQIDRYIKQLGAFGKLLCLTYESGHFDKIEELLITRGGSSNKTKRKSKTKRNKPRKNKPRKNKTMKKKKKDKKKYTKNTRTGINYKHSITRGGSWGLFRKFLFISFLVSIIVAVCLVSAAATASAAAAAAAANVVNAIGVTGMLFIMFWQIFEVTLDTLSGGPHGISCVNLWW